MYFEASLHGLKFKASGVSGVGGRSPARLKKAGGWVGGGGQPPPHLQTECSHDVLRKHSLKQACAAQKKRGDGSFVLPCLFVSLLPLAVLHNITW